MPGIRCHHNLLLITLFTILVAYTTALQITNLIIPPPSFTTSSNATITWIHDGQDPILVDIQLLHKAGKTDLIASGVAVSQSYFVATTPFSTLKVGGWGRVQLIQQTDKTVLAQTPRLRVQTGEVIVPFSQAVPVITQSNPTPTSTNAPPAETGTSDDSDDDTDAASGKAGASSLSNASPTSSTDSSGTSTSSTRSSSAASTLSLSPSPIYTATSTPTPASSSSGSSLSIGARAGIGIGVAGSVSLIGLTAIFFFTRYRRQKHEFRTKKSVNGSPYDPARDIPFRVTQGIGVFKAELEGATAGGKEVTQLQRSSPVSGASALPMASGSLPTVEEEESGDAVSADARELRRGQTFDTEVSLSERGAPPGRQQTFDTLSSVRQMHGGLATQRSWGTGTDSSDGPVELDAGTMDLEAQGINEPAERRSTRSRRFSFTPGDPRFGFGRSGDPGSPGNWI